MFNTPQVEPPSRAQRVLWNAVIVMQQTLPQTQFHTMNRIEIQHFWNNCMTLAEYVEEVNDGLETSGNRRNS